MSQLRARIFHLEMRGPPEASAGHPDGDVVLAKVRDIPLSFYRYLYREIGANYHWFRRTGLDDTELSRLVHAPSTIIIVVYVGGAPAGFYELSTANLPGETEIVYFGLLGEFHGRGLGRFFLSETIRHAWLTGPERVVVRTSNLDDPKALHLYQRLGFEMFDQTDETFEV